MKTCYNIILIISIAALLPFSAFSQYGILDETFSDDGKVITDASGFTDNVADVTVLQNGSIIVTGYSTYTDPDNETTTEIPSAIQYKVDGTLDSAFCDTGILVLAQSSYANSYFTCVRQQSNGQLVFFGNHHSDFLLLRVDPDGNPDDSFDGDGKVITDISGSYDFGNSMIIQSDGKIACVGKSLVGNLFQPIIARYNSDGSLDNSFGTGGVVLFPTASVSNFTDLKQQADGKLIAGGYELDTTTLQNIYLLVRFNTDGSVDNTFGTNGKVNLDFFGGSNQYCNKLALQDDGKIIAAGRVYVISGEACVARFNTDGSLDTTLQGTGKAVFTWGVLFSNVTDCFVQPDGKIVLTGYKSDGLTDESFALMRLETDGDIDYTFGTDGLVTTQFNGVALSTCSTIQDDGKIVAAGYNADDACTGRFTSGLFTGVYALAKSPTLDMSLYPNPANQLTTLSFSLPEQSNVEISIYNNMGEKVQTVYSGNFRKGVNSINVSLPASYPGGIYQCRLQTTAQTIVRPLVVAR